MNLFKSILTFIFVFSYCFSYSQESELKSIVGELNDNINEVNSSKVTFKQSVESPEPAVVKYHQEEVGSKGNTVRVYTFNLSDIDPYTVRSETSRDVIYVKFSVTNKQDLIGTQENGTIGKYQNELAILASDIDNARVLIDILKKSIEPAKTYMAKRLSVKTPEERMNWLKQNINTVELNGKSYQQSIKTGDYPGMVVLNSTNVTSKGSVVNEFSFNFADVDPPTVNFDISGEELSIEFETVRDQKIIRHFKDGQAQSFEKSLNIYTQSVEKARDLRQVLLLMIEDAKGQLKADIKNYTSSKDALGGVKKYLTEVNYGDEKIIQNMTGDCISTITLEESDSKGTTKSKYEFNFMDLNKDVIVFNVKGDQMLIELPVLNKIKLVKEYDGETFKGFTDDFTIYTPNVEIARRLEVALKRTIEECQNEYVSPYKAKGMTAMPWLLQAVKDVDKPDVNYKQVLEQIDKDNPYRLKFTKRSVDPKKSVEEIFEFNMADLNAQSVEFEINGNELKIKAESNYGEKLIKYYKDGQIGNYEDEVVFIFDDINTARGVRTALKELIDKASK